MNKSKNCQHLQRIILHIFSPPIRIYLLALCTSVIMPARAAVAIGDDHASTAAHALVISSNNPVYSGSDQIDDPRLPGGSLAINRPTSLYQIHKTIIWCGFTTIALLIVLIAVLLANIQKRKVVEKNLQRSEQQMSQIIDFLPDPTFVIDSQSRVIAWNRAMETLTGVKAEAIVGKGDHEYAIPFHGRRRSVLIDLVHNWDDEVKKSYKKVKKDGDRILAETRKPIQKLGNRHFKITAAPLYNKKGIGAGAIETLHDITERRTTERELADRETLLSLFVENTPAAVAMCDTEMNYLAHSHRWITDYHLPDEDLIGRCHYDVFRNIPDHWRQQHQRCFQGEVIETDEELFIRADGTRDWVRRNLHPLYNNDGNIDGLILFTEVVTQKKQIEKNLHLMERVLEKIPAILFRWQSLVNWSVVYVSDNIRQFGYSPEELLSGQIIYSSLIHPDDLFRVSSKVAQAAEQGTNHFRQEYRIVDKSGRAHWVDDRTVVERDTDGTIIYYQGVILDVTWRKQAEEKIKRSERMLRRIMDIVPSMIFVKNAQGRYLMANQAVADNYGMSLEKLVGSLQADIHPNQDQVRRYLANDLKTLQRNRPLYVLEEPFQDQTGATRWLEVIKVPCDVADFGEPAVVGLAMDVTEKRVAKAKLVDAHRILRLVMDTIPVRVFWKDTKCRYLGCNQPFAEDAGKTNPDELIGKNDYDFPWGANQAELYRRDDFAVMSSGKSQINFEGPQTAPDGRDIWVQTSRVPMRDMNGNIIGVLGTYQDITERKKAEEELRQLRNYLVNIINSMPSVLIGVDSKGLVTQWNQQAEKVTGLTFEMAQSRPLADVYPKLIDEMERIQTAIHSRRVLKDLKVPFQKNGEKRFEDITIFPLVANGVEGAVIRVDDVTQRVRLEEMMIQSEKMLSIGGLAAGMAHEINNPLAGIMQNAAVLENRLLGDLPANEKAAEAAGTTMATIRKYIEQRQLKTMMENISTSGERAATIVRNMLSFSRKSDQIISSHDLRVVMDETVELAQTDYDMKKHYDFKQIRIIREYAETMEPVPCEKSKIQQVFLNILKNGAEAMAESLSTREKSTFRLKIKDEGKWQVVEIADNGPGMDEKQRRRIFEPFFTTKPAGEGTGLGLSVSYFIITKNHAGEMDVYSRAGKGTQFIIRLPKTQKM